MRFRTCDLMPVDHRPEVRPQPRGIQEKVDILRLGVGGETERLMAMPLQELAQARYQGFIQHRPDGFAKKPLLGRAVCAHLFESQVTAEEIADNVVVAPAVHTLLHGLIRFDAKAAVIGGPDLAMNRIGVDDDAVHIEDQRQFTRQARLPSSANNSSFPRPRAARSLPARHRNATFPTPRAALRNGLSRT